MNDVPSNYQTLVRSALLVGTTPNFDDYFYFALTLNHPETKSFMKLLSVRQRNIYRNLIQEAKQCITKSAPINSWTAFEFTKRGKVHAHSILCVSKKDVVSKVGFICDYTKHMCRRLKAEWRNNYLYNNEHGISYKCPCVCMDYIKTIEDYNKWITYITKDIVES